MGGKTFEADFSDASSFFIDKPVDKPENSVRVIERENYCSYRTYAETKSERVQLLMQPTLKKELQALARRKGLSMNELIHRLLAKAIIDEEEKEKAK
jgi:predicted HicB family RNase H-like nuclease